MIGPGLCDWPAARAILIGEEIYARTATAVPPLSVLPPAERRRIGRVVRLAIAIGLEASRHAGMEPRALPTVFSSSNGDVENCHEICLALASTERSISPTRFHNAVHNAPAGYWSIATGATVASTMLCAYDASFAAGLLESLTQVAVQRRAVLLIAYDADYPSPLREKRPILDAFGIALVLTPDRSGRSLARVAANLSDLPAEFLQDQALEDLRAGAPAARALPLLGLLARRRSGVTHLEYLDGFSLRLELSPC